ncbi:MAG: DUF1643 domain-containing protein [Halothece sp.]
MMNQGAVIDPTGYYRYSLWRVWNPKASRVALIMLNPSRADTTVYLSLSYLKLNSDSIYGNKQFFVSFQFLK